MKITQFSTKQNVLLASALTIGSPATGDLSGTLPDPTVSAVNGVVISGTPVAGDVITATGPTTADWEPPASPRTFAFFMGG